jgi:HSP20 family molecular chaperone IbpA
MKRQAKIGLGGKINILGLEIPLGDACLEGLKTLREGLKTAGGKEILSDEEWLKGESSVSRGVCPRCGRRHSGPCGIPGTVTGHIPSAKPRVTPNPKRWPSTPIYPIRIEPLFDVFEEDSQIKVIFEMPGVEKEIKAFLEDRTLKVSAEGRKKFYEAEIELPRKVKAEFSQEYRNGILIITLESLRGKK